MSWLSTLGLSLDLTQTAALVALVASLMLVLLLVRAGVATRQRERADMALDRAAAARKRQETPQAAVSAEATPRIVPEAELTAELRRRLAGLPADGSLANGNGDAMPDHVVWVEDGDEVLVHLDSLRVQLLDRIVLASIDLESDQTGRQTLVVPLALASGPGPGGLLAVTEETPRGDSALVARWGRTLQEALWAGLLAVTRDHAATRGHMPVAISAAPGTLLLHSAAVVPVTEPVPARVS